MEKRLFSVDLVKICAMFMIIGLHTFCGSRGFCLTHVLYVTSGIGVPLFFMSSGYLLLGQKNKSYQYVFLKVYRILRLILIISFFYCLFAKLFVEHNFFCYFMEVIIDSCVQEGDLWICWYLWAMLVVYLCYPVINKMYQEHINCFNLLVLLLFITCLSAFFLNITLHCVEKNIAQTFRLWYWLFYFCLGGFVKKHRESISQGVLWVGSLFFLALNFISHELFLVWIGEEACEYYYGSLSIMITVITFFILSLKTEIKNPKLMLGLSPLFLPIYILHPFVLDVIMHPSVFSYMHSDWMPFYFYRFLLVSIVTLILSWLLFKVPIVRDNIKI
jgi:surface polysaccharide O-acyltransferase-like enzyme